MKLSVLQRVSQKLLKWNFVALFIVLISSSFTPKILAAQITLAWDETAGTDLAGYKVYYGTTCGDYKSVVDVGNQTTSTISGLETDKIYCFAATSYDAKGNESDFSEPLVTNIPFVDGDGDGLSDDDETQLYRTNPSLADTDGDGIDDGSELVYWGAFWNSDHDGDGVINLLDADSDNDSYLDGAEISGGYDPADASSHENKQDLTPSSVVITKGNFDSDAAKEFAVGEIQSDSTVKLTIFDNNGNILHEFSTITAKEIDLSSGNFDNDSQDELVLACVRDDQSLITMIFDAGGTLLSTGTGGECTDVHVAVAQFDNDSYNEYVVALVQSNGTLAAITFDQNGSRIGKGVGGICSNLDVSAGNFDDNPGDDEYVISLLQSDGTLAAITFQSEGKRIGKGTGGKCSNVSVARGNFIDNNNRDEYVISLLQADDTLAAISYYADGARISKGVASKSSKPKIASGRFYDTYPLDGYVIATKKDDGTAEAIFFRADGTQISKTAGYETVIDIDVTCGDIENSGYDQAIVAYVNQNDFIKWTVFDDLAVPLISGP